MKDLGEPDIKLVREGDVGLTLTWSHYMEKIMNRFGYCDCKPSPTPYDASENWENK